MLDTVFFVKVYHDLISCPFLAGNIFVSPLSTLVMFLPCMFDVCTSVKHSPSNRCAHDANVVGKYIDMIETYFIIT
jgi:hypothetical protein